MLLLLIDWIIHSAKDLIKNQIEKGNSNVFTLLQVS